MDEPLIGAWLFEVGFPNNGTTSDLDGNYTLYVHSEHNMITCMYIGYETVTLMRLNQILNFKLVEATSLEEALPPQETKEAFKKEPEMHK